MFFRYEDHRKITRKTYTKSDKLRLYFSIVITMLHIDNHGRRGFNYHSVIEMS